jgi:UDP-N-acetylglucosamine 1-carboxyvinyltransferase
MSPSPDILRHFGRKATASCGIRWSPEEGPATRLVIQGGQPISGSIEPAGNKNEALPLLAAVLLVPGQVVLENVPRIHDVEVLVRILGDLGARAEYSGAHELDIDATSLRHSRPDPELASEIRGSFLLAAPLLARFGEAVLPRPGGDRIGRRRLDTHLLALGQLGARIEEDGGAYRLELDGRFRGAEVFLDEASVTATEAAIMASVLADGSSRILNAACEPHVQGLCRALNGMGARIRGIGTNVLEIDGVAALHPGRHRLSPDHIEVGSFVAIAAMTGGELRIPGVVADDLRMIRLAYARLGVETLLEGTTLVVPGDQKRAVQADVDGGITKIDDAPWPGFPADLTSLALVLATQCHGTVLIHEKLFESRLFFVDRVIAMGARVVLCDPHRAVVIGPSRLHGARIASPDIRAGMALLGAALCADGRSTIDNVQQIDRGYERVDERLRALGADILREGR